MLSLTSTAAILYATVSASFVIEQEGLPSLSQSEPRDEVATERWNDDIPQRRLEVLMDTKVV